MTNEKMLKMVYSAVKTLPEYERETIEKLSKENITKAPNENIVFYLSQIIYELKEDIGKETAKKAGKGDALKAAKKTLKQGIKIRNCLGYAPIIEGKQYICNSYLAVESAKPLPLPELPTNTTYFDIKKLIRRPENAETIELPNTAKLKAYIKVQKSFDKLSRVCYDFGDGKPLVNAEYLLQVMEMLSSETAYININQPLSSVYFESENGRAILMPTRPKDGTPRVKTEL